jgi:hypothetical protein
LTAQALRLAQFLIPARCLYTGPFHAALRTAIQRSGLTLDRLRSHLARRGIWVGLSSLSDWQTGRSLPGANSLRTVRALEEILALPAGCLVDLIQERRVTDIGAVAELLDALPGSRDRGVELISVHNKITIDARRGSTVTWTRTAIRALRAGIDRHVVRYYGNPGCVPAQVRPRALGNCRLGQIVPHPSEPALVYELLFDQTLDAGETWVFEAGIADPSGAVCTEFAYGFRFPAEQYLLEVRFHPNALPVRCYSFAQRDLADERHPTGALPLSRHHSVHLVESGVRSGVLGIKWDWPL